VEKNGIEKHAAFHHGYLIDDRSLLPLTIAWVSAVGPRARPLTAQLAARASPSGL
jgi:hypothetical protein